MEFHPVLVTDIFGFIDLLVRFWGQNVKGPENIVNTISQKPMKGIWPNFDNICIWTRRCTG